MDTQYKYSQSRKRMSQSSQDAPDDSRPSVQPADPAHRRIAIVGILLINTAGAVLIWLVTRQIDRLVDLTGLEHAALIICLAMILVSLGILPTALYLYTTGRRIRQAERFPPPGMAVIRNTPVITGPPARRRGTILMILAVILVIVAAYLFAYALTVYRTFPH